MWRKERCNVLFFCGVKVFLTVPACGGFGRPCRFTAKGARGGGIRYSCQRSWALSIRGGGSTDGGMDEVCRTASHWRGGLSTARRAGFCSYPRGEDYFPSLKNIADGAFP